MESVLRVDPPLPTRLDIEDACPNVGFVTVTDLAFAIKVPYWLCQRF